jgi:soluble lytic murein transglycosylase-like protein
MIHSIMESPEFKGQNIHPIFAVYVNLLGREPEPEAFYYWSGVPTEEAIAHILDSPEIVATTGLDFVWTHKSIEQILIDAADEFGINRTVFLRIAWCESKHDPDATNSLSGAAGLLQHLPQYFGPRAAAVGMAGASVYDPVANARAGAWLMAQQGTRPWSCK